MDTLAQIAQNETLLTDNLDSEFPAMTNAERKAQAKEVAREKLRLAREERIRQKQECVGHIYVIGSECETYPYKIGLSKSGVKDRVNTMQTSHWANLKIFFESPPIPQVETVEKLLHKKYAKKRVRGEWFKLTKRDIANIAKDLVVYVAEAQCKKQDKIAKENEKVARQREKNRLLSNEELMERYLIDKGLPPTILTENYHKYIIPRTWVMRKVVVDAVIRSNNAIMKTEKHRKKMIIPRHDLYT